jgi:hypothetical protein
MSDFTLQSTKHVGLAKLPSVLILHLKSINSDDREFLTRVKLDPELTFTSTEDRRLKYSLYGVVEHVGAGSDQTHYVAYVKVRPNLLSFFRCAPAGDSYVIVQEEHGAWYQVNDSAVTPVHWEQVRNRQPHLLFYSANNTVPQSQRTASSKHPSAVSSDCIVGEAVGRWQVTTVNTLGEYYGTRYPYTERVQQTNPLSCTFTRRCFFSGRGRH